MNPHPRPSHPLREPAPARATAGASGRLAQALEWEALPSLAHILAHYREHGTVASTVAGWNPTSPKGQPAASVRPFAEVIEGLQTRELDGGDLFEQFFGPDRP